jgi:hypothetical protein
MTTPTIAVANAALTVCIAFSLCLTALPGVEKAIVGYGKQK